MKHLIKLLQFPVVDTKDVPNVALALAAACGLLAFGLSLRTLHPGVGQTIDSIELQTAARVGGIIHPPGSPQYLALGYVIMNGLPGHNAALRLNLFSAVCSALMIGVVYLLSYRLTRNLWAAGLAAMALALAPQVWYLASVSELYALNSLYTALVIYLLVAWHQSRKAAPFWAATALYAFSFGNHLSMILLLPAYLYIVNDTDRTLLVRPRSLALIAGLVVLGAAQYAYIPLRVAADPPFCNYCPGLLSDPLRYVTGPFLDYITGGPFKGAMFGLSAREALARLPDAIGEFNRQFLPWGYALGIIGGWELFRRQASLGWLLTLGIMGHYVFVMGYDIPDWYDFLAPAYVLFAPLIGFGAVRIWEITEPLIRDYAAHGQGWAAWAYPASLIGMMGAALGLAFFTHLPYVDQSENTAFREGSQALLAAAEPDAWLLMPPASSPSFYYSWAVRFTAFDQGRPLRLIASPEIVPPPGPPPYYTPWADFAPSLAPEALPALDGQLLALDPTDPRLADVGLLVVCIPGTGGIAGYEAVAVRQGGQVVPLVPPDRWQQVNGQVIYGGEAAPGCG